MPKKQVDYRKRIISLLRIRPYAFSDLQRASNLSNTALSRVLNELKNDYGIVNKNTVGEWYFIGQETESDFEKDQRLKHSEELISGLNTLQKGLLVSPYEGISVIQRDKEKATLVKAAEEHLKEAYPKIYSNILKCREKLAEALSSDSKNQIDAFAKAELIRPEENHAIVLVSPIKIPRKGLGQFFPETRYRKLIIPFILRFESVEDAQQALTMANAKPPYEMHVQQDGYCDVMGPLHFESNPKQFDQVFQFYGDAFKEIQILIAKIKYAKQPLKGSCVLCQLS